MAVNTHPHSGHLLCHDDVIGDRAVSFIIYLVDPDGWTADDGGALELYPLTDLSKVYFEMMHGDLRSFLARARLLTSAFLRTGMNVQAQGVPALSPSTTIVPQFNCMAFFNVLPGMCSLPMYMRCLRAFTFGTR